MKSKKTPVSPRNSKLNFGGISFLVLFGLTLAGCVTVNVNFPESAVQKASDDYVRDLYRTKEQGHLTTPTSTATPTSGAVFSFPQHIFSAVIATAEAQEPTFNMSSPKIDSIKVKMKANVPDVIEQKKAGTLGENQQGKLMLHNSGALKPLLKKKLEDLVHNENQLRDSLYAEVMSSNHLPANSAPAVRKSFARSFQAESPSGTWIENADGSWTQKP